MEDILSETKKREGILFETKKLDPIKRRIIVIGYHFDMVKHVENHDSFLKFVKNSFKAVPTALGTIFSPYTYYDVNTAKDFFKFAPGHPLINAAYGMCDLIPDQYVPISSFHEYFRHLKHSSFFELCANLGAKEVKLDYAKIDNKELRIGAGVEIPSELDELNLGVKYKKDTRVTENIGFTFSEENKEINDYNSPWMDTEPTWGLMKKMRKEHRVTTHKATFSYNEDFGINIGVATNLKNSGINIGGKFKEMKDVNLEYEVIFW